MSESIQPGAHDALIMVDVQVDFCPGGRLAVPDGDAVVPVLNRVAQLVPVVVATRDWHPPNHCSFVTQGGDWPVHCVIDSPGAEYHPDLRTDLVTVHVQKAFTPDRDTFDGFTGAPDLAAELRARGVTRVFVGGLATEYCVLHTALGALAAGFETYVLRDGSRAVNVQPGDEERAISRMIEAGVKVVDSSEIGG